MGLDTARRIVASVDLPVSIDFEGGYVVSPGDVAANAARLVEDSPALMQLRLLQMVGEQSGNTIVLGTAPVAPHKPPAGRAQRWRIFAPASSAHARGCEHRLRAYRSE